MAAVQPDIQMLAPCGINCMLCYKHLGPKPCSGCLQGDAGKPEHAKHCRIKGCAASQNVIRCHACNAFPCPKLHSLDRIYRKRYGVSLREAGLQMRTLGEVAFLRKQIAQYTCESCGGLVCLHTNACSVCGHNHDPERRRDTNELE